MALDPQQLATLYPFDSLRRDTLEHLAGEAQLHRPFRRGGGRVGPLSRSPRCTRGEWAEVAHLCRERATVSSACAARWLV